MFNHWFGSRYVALECKLSWRYIYEHQALDLELRRKTELQMKFHVYRGKYIKTDDVSKEECPVIIEKHIKWNFKAFSRKPQPMKISTARGRRNIGRWVRNRSSRYLLINISQVFEICWKAGVVKRNGGNVVEDQEPGFCFSDQGDQSVV